MVEVKEQFQLTKQFNMSDMNAILMGNVAETFTLNGRQGVIVAPAEPWATAFRVGEKVRLEKPDGEMLSVIIRGIAMMNPPIFSNKEAIVLGADGLSKTDVPIGSSLWLVRE